MTVRVVYGGVGTMLFAIKESETADGLAARVRVLTGGDAAGLVFNDGVLVGGLPLVQQGVVDGSVLRSLAT